MEEQVTLLEKPFYLLGLNSPSLRFVAVSVISGVVLQVTKPNMFFDQKGNTLSFGTGNNQTLLPWWFVSLGLGTLSSFFI